MLLGIVLMYLPATATRHATYECASVYTWRDLLTLNQTRPYGLLQQCVQYSTVSNKNREVLRPNRWRVCGGDDSVIAVISFEVFFFSIYFPILVLVCTNRRQQHTTAPYSQAVWRRECFNFFSTVVYFFPRIHHNFPPTCLLAIRIYFICIK